MVMREILFKGFRMDGNGWVEGDLLHGFAGAYCTIKTKDNYKEVDRTSICQFTGMKDINGNKIFENDIVKDKGGIKYIVEYVGVLFRLSRFENSSEGEYLDFHQVEGLIVVGNMWTYSMIPRNSKCYRALVLLDSARKLLERQESSDIDLNLLEETVYYDDALCDGNCLLNDIRSYFDCKEYSNEGA